MFDPSAQPSTQQACEAGYEFEPVYPGTSKGITAWITVRGPHSEAVRQYSQAAIEQARERAMLARRTQAADSATVQQIEEQLIEAAVAYTIGWRDMTVPYSPTAARELYRTQPWIREQVLDKGRDLGNFVKPCLPSCTPTPAPSFAST